MKTTDDIKDVLIDEQTRLLKEQGQALREGVKLRNEAVDLLHEAQRVADYMAYLGFLAGGMVVSYVVVAYVGWLLNDILATL